MIVLRYRYLFVEESVFDMEAKLDELGELGWELISVNTCPFSPATLREFRQEYLDRIEKSDAEDRWQLYFKKPGKFESTCTDLKRWRYHLFDVDFDDVNDMLDEDIFDESARDGWVLASMIVDPYNDDRRHGVMKQDRSMVDFSWAKRPEDTEWKTK